MASGRVHDLSIAILFPPVLIQNAHAPAILSVSYLVGGIWLSPDVDYLIQSRPSQGLSILSPLWEPYRYVSGQRGFSHVPVIGTLSRIAYLTIPVKMWMLVVKYNPTSLILQNREALLALFMGLEISCIVHLVMDYTPGLNRLR